MDKWSTLPLRIGLGIVFVAHGLQKAFGLMDGSGIAGFSQMLSSLGFEPGLFWAYSVAYIELVGGIFLIVGFLTRMSAGLLALVMMGALFKVHLQNGFFNMNGGFEYNFVVLCICVSLLISGQGALGISWLRKL